MSNQSRRAFRNSEAYRKSRRYIRQHDECEEHLWSIPVNGIQRCAACDAKRKPITESEARK